MSALGLDPFPVAPAPAKSGPLDLQRLGAGRVRIHTVEAGEHATNAVLAWLDAHRDVEAVDYDRGTGSIDVRYRESRAGAFVCSLRDRLFTIDRPPPPRGFRIVLAHGIAGRARFRRPGALN